MSGNLPGVSLPLPEPLAGAKGISQQLLSERWSVPGGVVLAQYSQSPAIALPTTENAPTRMNSITVTRLTANHRIPFIR